ncbi:MAG: uroporphyrinogen decarboxylase family protein [Clostridia bacterium]
MTSKERVIAALNHKESDRVPRGENAFNSVYFEQVMGYKTLCYGGWDELEALWAGNRDKIVADYVDAIVGLTKKMQWDYIRVPVAPKKKDYSGYKRISERLFEDNTGKKFHFNPEAGNVVCPDSYNTDITIDDIVEDPNFSVDECEMEIAKAIIDKLGDTHFIMGRPSIGGTFPYLNTVGMEEYMIRMITEPEFVHKLADIECKKAIAYIDAFMDIGCDGIMVTEDYADNKGITVGVQRYEEFIMPYLKRVCNAVHSRGAYFIKHTDGVMWDILDSFVEMGIDGWHGIQPSAGMDIKRLKEKYEGKLCLFGGMNVETLIAGTPEEVKAEAVYAMKHGAPGGGFVLTGGNILEPGVKPENYYAAIEAWKEFGNYPIKID